MGFEYLFLIEAKNTILCPQMCRILLTRVTCKRFSGVPEKHICRYAKGRSTTNYFVNCLSNDTDTCRAFIDFKGAFDKANRDLIMEELIMKGVQSI